MIGSFMYLCCILCMFSSYFTYGRLQITIHQNLWNWLVISPITKSGDWNDMKSYRHWWLILWLKDCQQWALFCRHWTRWLMKEYTTEPPVTPTFLSLAMASRSFWIRSFSRAEAFPASLCHRGSRSMLRQARLVVSDIKPKVLPLDPVPRRLVKEVLILTFRTQN